MNFFRKLFDRRSNLSEPQEWLLNLLTMGYESKAGINVTRNDAIQVSAVFACVKLISETMASLPLVLHKQTAEGKEKAEKHDLYYLLHYMPNPETTAFDFWVMFIVNLLLCEGAYAYVKRDRSGKILELWNIPSSNVTTYRNQKTDEIYYKVKDENTNQEAVFYPENIMYTRGMRFGKRDASLDPVAIAREALGLSLALEEYGGKYFKNGANSGGIIEVPGALSDEAFKRFKESFLEKYAGIGNSSKVMFLESGTKYQKVGNSPEESQAIESRKFQVLEIARFFNVPPHKIMALEHATFSNIEQQSIDFVQSCLNPHAVRLEQTIYKDLLRPTERKRYFAKFHLQGLLRGDMDARKEYYQAGIQNGWLSPNDVRELEDMNKIENGDIHMVNGNMIPLANILQVKGGEGNNE